MDNLPVEVIRKIYSYDSTYKIKFDKVLTQLTSYCFIYRCKECFKEWDRCYCYCPRCRTYLKYCQQIYFNELSFETYLRTNVAKMHVAQRIS